MTSEELLARLEAQVGNELHVSDWLAVSQAMIDAFAQATGDSQWIHVDAERAAQESPYGATIAHGFLTLSLYPRLRGFVGDEADAYPGVKNIINYGLNRVRFPNAVLAGSKIRARCTLLAVEMVKGSIQMTEQYAVEIENQERPACVAETVLRLYF